jgi:hypothetical protein
VLSRRAALYTVAVRSKGKAKEQRPLGDLDGRGTSAASALAAILGGFSQASRDGSRLVRSLLVQAAGDEVFAIVQYGQSGIAADIVSPSGSLRLRQVPGDEQLVRCGCLFRLPAAASSGSLAVEVDDGRGIEGLLEQALVTAFASTFDSLALAIAPVVEAGGLRAAVSGGLADTVELLRLVPAQSASSIGVDRWVAPGTPARLRLEITVGSGSGGIRGDLVGRYLDGDAGAFAQLVEFAGIRFDSVRIGVTRPDASRRSFDLARPAEGRSEKRDLDGVELDTDGEPTAGSLLAALRSVLDSVSEPHMLGA